MVVFDAGPDHTHVDSARAVRLLGYFTPARADAATSPGRRGLAMLLHGWEGNSHSAYNLVLGSALIRAGYDVVRLNMRDHGPTHHLNKGIFNAMLIEEVHAATQQVGLLARGGPLYLIGASLGGNFVIRMALRHARFPIPNLRRAMAINPVLNPQRTSFILDHHPFLRRYFRNRWLESLRKKQALFPDLYDFGPLESISTILEMSDWVIRSMSAFNDVDEYLNAYSVKPKEIYDLAVPVSILTAANDPLIPPEDIAALPSYPLLQVNVLPFGGHVGYNDLFPLRNRLPELVRLLLEQDTRVE
jgi:predicted alpha/beta-fold hydrolase